MSRGCGTAWGRRLVAVVTGAGLLALGPALLGPGLLRAGLLPPALVGTAVAAPAAAPAATRPATPATVDVEQLTPSTLTRTSTLVIRGTVVNRAPTPLSQLTIALHLGGPVSGRAELHALWAAPVAQPLAARQQALGTGPLAPGGRRAYTLSLRVRDLPLSASGVYPLQVTAVGLLGGAYRDLGSADTAVPYLATRPTHRMPLTTVVPLQSAPALAGDDALLDASTEARLRDEVSGGGRLDDALGLARSPGATLVLDPAVVDAVRVLAGPHRTDGMNGTRAADPGARAWLARLRAVAARTDLVRLPYGDPDLSALARGGLPELLPEADGRGASVLRQTLGTAGDTSVAVPPGATADPAALDLIATRLGGSAVLLRGDSVSSEAGTAVATIAGRAAPARAVLTDPSTTALLAAGPGGSPTLALQDVVAEASAAALDTPSRPGAGLVVELPTSGDLSWDTQAITALTSSALLAPTGLPALASVRASALASVTPGSGPTPPAATLPDDVVGAVRATRADLGDLRASLQAGALAAGERGISPAVCPEDGTADSRLTDAACRALLLAVSAAWRPGQPAPLPGGGGVAGAFVQQGLAVATLGGIRSQVRAVASREVALTSRTGRVPVTLENDLTEPVQVLLDLSTAAQGSVQSGTAVTRTVQPGQKVQVEIEVRASAAGTFPVTLSLHSAGGRPFGPPFQVLVRSTAFGELAVALTGGALAVLLVAVLYRAVRGLLRRRARRGSPPDERDGPDGPETDGTAPGSRTTSAGRSA